jgi:signal transduction histidine kinase
LALGLTATGAVTAFIYKSSRDHDRERFESMTRTIHEVVETRLEKYALGLGALQDFFTRSVTVTEMEWHKRLDQFKLAMNYSGMVEVGYGHLWGGDWFGWPPEVAMHRIVGQPMPPSTSRNQGWRHLPLLFHASPGQHIQPEYGQETLADEDRAGAWPNAYNNNSLEFTSRKSVPGARDGRPASAFKMLLPVYLQAMPGRSMLAAAVTNRPGDDVQRHLWHERGHNVRGVVFATIAMDEFLDSIFGDKPQEVEFEIFDGPMRTRAHWLNDRRGVSRAEDPGHRPYLSKTVTARPWSVYFHTTPLFEARSQRHLPWVALIIGLVFSGLLAGITFGQVRARWQEEGISRELRQSRDQVRLALKDRERLSRDLHDGTIQSIYAVGLGLDHCLKLVASKPEEASRRLAQAKDELNEVIFELRQFITSLEPEILKGQPFHQALESLAARMSRTTTTRIQVEAEARLSERLEPWHSIHLINIAREAVNNCIRHGNAGTLTIALRDLAGGLEFSITDDGAGFETNESVNTGHGLRNMAARAAEMGATWTVDSRPGKGARIVVLLPGPGTARPETS